MVLQQMRGLSSQVRFAANPPLLPYQHTSVPAGPCSVCRALFFLLGLVLRAPVLPAASTPAASPCKSQEAPGTIPKDAGKAPAKPRACHPQKAAAWGRVALGTRGHSTTSTCMSRPLPPPSATPALAAAGEAPGARAQRPARPPGLLAAGAITPKPPNRASEHWVLQLAAARRHSASPSYGGEGEPGGKYPKV